MLDKIRLISTYHEQEINITLPKESFLRIETDKGVFIEIKESGEEDPIGIIIDVFNEEGDLLDGSTSLLYPEEEFID